MIHVLSPGLLSTVQDTGRQGFAQVGVSAAGAADPVSLHIANQLVGNSRYAAAIEMTLQGGSYELAEPATIAITGGDFDCSHEMWRAIEVQKGDVVRIGGCRSGARVYLAVRGGIDTPRVLGSASTHSLSGFGHTLRKGDKLPVGTMADLPVATEPAPRPEFRKTLRVTPGAQARQFSGDAPFDFLGGAYKVRDDSSRMGIRLTGPRIAPPFHGQMPSEGVPLGAVQVPAAGEPIILFVDAQTTGGYPAIACVISADLYCLGQLRPRDEVRFEPVTIEQAVKLLREQPEY